MYNSNQNNQYNYLYNTCRNGNYSQQNCIKCICNSQCNNNNQSNNQPSIHLCKYNQNYSAECFPKQINIYTPWQTISYAGSQSLPVPETPDAGSWPLCFLKRDSNNQFLTPYGEIFNITIKDPHLSLNLASEFAYLSNIQCNLTDEQVKIAKYWGDGPATKQFMPIADILIDTYGVSVCHSARILYILNGALNDNFVVTWYLKYFWNIMRPCQYNQCFRTVICTPMHPTYPAGHATSAGCMAEILSYFFPAEREKLFMLAKQCADSRNFAGVHFKLDCDEGIKLGVSIAKSILAYTSVQTNSNNQIIDVVYTEYKNANIIPTCLCQYIPFNRQSICNSLILDINSCD